MPPNNLFHQNNVSSVNEKVCKANSQLNVKVNILPGKFNEYAEYKLQNSIRSK